MTRNVTRLKVENSGTESRRLRANGRTELARSTCEIAFIHHAVIHMNDDNVIPFRRRPQLPSEAELEAYRQATRNWHPEVRRLKYPEHYELELKYADD